MAFNIFQSPFEKLSLENQLLMLEDIKAIKAALSNEKSPFISAIFNISEKINTLVEVQGKIYDLISGKSKEGGDGLEAAQMKALGITAESFGKGLKLIVEAVEAYSKVDPKKFEELIEGIVKMGDAFKKMEPAFKLFQELPKTLGYLALGILGLGLALIIAIPIYIAALPAVPLVIFVLKTFLMAFAGMVEAEKEGLLTKGAQVLQKIAVSLVLFGLAILLMGPIYILDLVMMWPIIGVLALFLMVFKALSSKYLQEDVVKGAGTLKGIAWTIALFGLAILLVGPLYIAAAIFVIPIVFTLLAFALVMWALSKVDKDIREGVYSLLIIGIAIVVFALALWAWNKLRPSWEDIFQTIVIIGAFALILYIVGDQAKNMIKAAIALIIAGVAMIVLAVAITMLLNAVNRDWAMIEMVGAIIGGLTIAMLLLGNNATNVLLGSVALILSSVAIILLAVSIKMLLNAVDRDWEQIGMVGATIAMIGIEFGLMGIPVVAAFILLGATAAITAATALVLIGVSLSIFKASGWKESDQTILTSALAGIRNAFLGLDGNEGFLGTIKAIAQSTLLAASLVAISAMYIPVGIALTLIGASLGIFKSIGFKQSDADTMKYVVQSISDAFMAPFSDESGNFKFGKFLSISLGIEALSKASNTLAGLAEGVQAWTNLTVPKWEYDEKSGEMKIKGKVKLTEKDFDTVAYSMQKVISAISGPFAEVGKLEMGLTGGDPFYASIFGGGYVSKGIEALSGIGNVMSGLSQGVQDFANLTITEWDVIQGKNGPELKPVKKRTMTGKEIDSAVKNMAKIAVTTATVFAEVARINAGEKPKDPALAFLNAVFGGDLVQEGVEALGGIGDVMVGLAEGVMKFANMEFVTHKIVINNNGIPELVPDKIVKITQVDIDFAMKNLSSVAGTVARVFSEIGKGNWWSNGEDIDPDDVEDGIKALSGIGDIMVGLADGIMKFANMEFVTQIVKDVDGIPTLVPGEVVKISQKDIDMAVSNMSTVAISVAKAIVNAGNYIDENSDAMDAGIEYIPQASEAVTVVAEAILKANESLSKVKDVNSISTAIKGFITSTIDPFAAADITTRMTALEIFTERIEIIASSADEMKKVAKSLESISKSMGVYRKEINALDPKLLSETRALYEAMAVISESGSIQDLLDKYGKTIEDTFEKLAELLEKFADKVSETTNGGSTTTPIPNGTPATKLAIEKPEAKTDAAAQLSGSIKTMVLSLQSIDSQLRSGIKTKQAMF